MLDALTTKALNGFGCTAAEALWLATEPDEADLFAAATRIRQHYFCNTVQLCSIINAKSGRCDMDCCFCSQSGHHSTKIEEYPFMDLDELEQHIAADLHAGDRRCGVVTSGGKLSGEELNVLLEAAQRLSNGLLCASLGRLTNEELAALKAAGITRFHHNLEASEKYYPNICSTQTWQQRLATVKAALDAGLEVCCGGLFGLGESWQDRIDLAISLHEMGIEHVPINFLYSHAGTPLAGTPPLEADEALRIIAVYRFLLPKATLRICGGRVHVLGNRQSDLFAAGANGLMTGNYLTVSGQTPDADLKMIADLGLEVQQQPR